MSWRTSQWLWGLSALTVMTVPAGLVFTGPAQAQTYKSITIPEQPLVLKARGSFFVGGRTVEQTAADILLGPDDSVTVDQMYVEYMVPTGTPRIPFIMVHGATLSGKTYDTTPDGRMGWFEYFVRKSHPTYVVDQVGRARSGFNQQVMNRRFAGKLDSDTGSAEAPGRRRNGAFRLGDRTGVWTNMRIGPKPGEAFPGSKFPIQAAGEFSKQQVPDLISQVPTPNPTYSALAQLATELGGAILMGHSQSGGFPMEAVLTNPDGIRGIVTVEPGACRADYTSDQIAVLAKVPTLVLFGDYLTAETGLGGPNWQDRLDGCRAYAARIKAAGGRVEIVHLPEKGIRGNSHMLMQDTNNTQIADIILDWADRALRGRSS